MLAPGLVTIRLERSMKNTFKATASMILAVWIVTSPSIAIAQEKAKRPLTSSQQKLKDCGAKWQEEKEIEGRERPRSLECFPEHLHESQGQLRQTVQHENRLPTADSAARLIRVG